MNTCNSHFKLKDVHWLLVSAYMMTLIQHSPLQMLAPLQALLCSCNWIIIQLKNRFYLCIFLKYTQKYWTMLGKSWGITWFSLNCHRRPRVLTITYFIDTTPNRCKSWTQPRPLTWLEPGLSWSCKNQNTSAELIAFKVDIYIRHILSLNQVVRITYTLTSIFQRYTVLVHTRSHEEELLQV